MNRISAVSALFVAVGVILAGCNGNRQSDSSAERVQVPRLVENNGKVGLENRGVDVPRGADAVRTAVESLLSDSSHPLPEGTKLLELKIEDAVAHLNLSRDFNKLEGMGNEGESIAQKALKQTLGQFKNVDKMLVRVEGKPFESQHTDWTVPISVRDNDDVAQRDRRPAITVSPPGGGE